MSFTIEYRVPALIQGASSFLAGRGAAKQQVEAQEVQMEAARNARTSAGIAQGTQAALQGLTSMYTVPAMAQYQQDQWRDRMQTLAVLQRTGFLPENLPEVEVGDYTIIHVGFAITKLDEEAAQDIGVNRCGGGPAGELRVVLNETEHPRASGVVEDAQGREEAYRLRLGKEVEDDADQGRGEASQDEHLHRALQLATVLHHVDHHEEEADAKDDLGEVAEGLLAQASVAQAGHEGEESQCDEGQDGKDQG